MIRILKISHYILPNGRFFTGFFALAFLLVGISPSMAEPPLITISEAVWTNGVDNNKNPMKRYEDSVEGNRQIYLWTKLQGEDEALSYLKNRGKLPIRHQWYVYLGPDPSFEETMEPIDAVRLTVGGKDVLQKLNWQLQEKGHFEWRTWSAKKNTRPGWWKVKIVYSDGEPVLCEDDPCEYFIEIKD